MRAVTSVLVFLVSLSAVASLLLTWRLINQTAQEDLWNLVLAAIATIASGITGLLLWRSYLKASHASKTDSFPAQTLSLIQPALPASQPNAKQDEDLKRLPLVANEPRPLPAKAHNESEALENTAWVGLAEECVALFDELERHKPDFSAAQQEVTDHVQTRLLELLERSGVEIIVTDKSFDRLRHQAEKASHKVPRGTAIQAVISPGFAIGRRILRRARVQVSVS